MNNGCPDLAAISVAQKSKLLKACSLEAPGFGGGPVLYFRTSLIPALIMLPFIICLFGTGETKICFQFPSVINLMISSVFFLTGYTF
jgi:hypothetical protein